MMGVGHMSGGGYSSSSNSNLSALAAPFTVERQSPNPYPPNPNSHYSASSYGIKPYNNPQWDNYASPSAPVTEVPIHSTGINNQPSVDEYLYKDTASQSSLSGHFSGDFHGSSSGAKYVGGGHDYGAKVDPYYRPFVPSSVGEDDKPFWDEGSRRYVDFSGYGNNNQVDLDGNFLSLKLNDGGQVNQIYQGGGRTYGDKIGEGSGFLYQHNSDVSSREVTGGPFSVGNTEDDSRIWKLAGFIPYESDGVKLGGSSSTYPQPLPSVPSFETPITIPSYYSSFGSYENCNRTVDSPFTGPTSVARYSPAVVIRPPLAFDCNFPQANISHESAPRDDGGGSLGRNFDNSGSLRKKNSLMNFGCEMKENSLEASDKFRASSSAEKLPSQLVAEDALDRKIGGESESKMSYMNAPDACPSARGNITVAIESNDVIDYQNTAVDSPCWRGAPPIQFPLVDVEAAISNPFSKITKGNYEVRREELENLNSAVHSKAARPEKVEGKEKAENGVWGNTDAGLEVLTVNSRRGFQIFDDPNISGINCNLLNDLNIGSGAKTLSAEQFNDENNAGMTLNDVPEGIAAAVRAAEEVLRSPSSQEDTECNKNPSGPKFNVPVMIKVIHNLSELVMCNIAGGAFNLDDESSQSLRQSICNLKACMSKQIAQNNNEARAEIPIGDILGISGDSVYTANLSGDHAAREAKNSHNLPDAKRNYDSAIKENEKLPVESPPLDDWEMPIDDATKAIHRILEEDFLIDEEMNQQALLYKNLWLESEAELCAIGYRARYDRMRIRMGKKIKSGAPQGSTGVVNDCAEKSTRPLNISAPSTHGHGDGVETSFMDRSNILKSRGENIEAFISEIQPQTMIGYCIPSGSSFSQLSINELKSKAADDAQSVMSRFDILKSREENLKSDNEGEKFQTKVTNGDEGDEQMNPMMARYNILKSREDNFKSDNAGEKFQVKTIDYEEEQVNPITARYNVLKSRDEGLNINNMENVGANVEYAGILGSSGIAGSSKTSKVVVEPYFLYPRGQDLDPRGYESLKEYTSSKVDAVLDPIAKGKIVNEDHARWPEGSSSSDWEHVQRDEFSCNNY